MILFFAGWLLYSIVWFLLLSWTAFFSPWAPLILGPMLGFLHAWKYS